MESDADLLKVVDASDFLAVPQSSRMSRQQHDCENRDDRDNDHEFEEGKPCISLIDCDHYETCITDPLDAQRISFGLHVEFQRLV